MCGLVAWHSRNGIEVDRLGAALDHLRPRGPDGTGFWVAPDQQVALGHVRLAINDLAGGDQPLVSEDGEVRAVVAGEFYGFRALREALRRDGHRFATASDSEILLHLYEDRGDAAVDALRGEFSFVLWDARRRRLLAGRDRFGVKPLFWAEGPWGLGLASEAKALFALGHPARWDRDTLYQHMAAFPAPQRTLFAGVRQVPPGHCLIADESGVRLECYWDLDYPLDSNHQGGSEGELAEQLSHHLREAVALRLEADVPVVTMLSGGLDSSLVLGLASAIEGRGVPAFTVGFEVEGYNESDLAQESARLWAAPHVSVRLRPADLADGFAEATYRAETLGINAHGIARLQLCRVIREAGFKVALSGEGADELFAGYGFPAHREQLAPASELEALAPVRSRLGFVPPWLDRLALARAPFQLLLSSTCVSRQPSEAWAAFVDGFDHVGQLRGRPELLQSLYLWSRSILPDYILYAERLELGQAVEARLPYLDHRLFEWVRQLPLAMLAGRDRDKALLRQAARPFVSAAVHGQPKQPFTAPPFSGDDNDPLHELIADRLASETLEAVPLLDPGAVRSLFAALPELDDRRRRALEPVFLMIASATILAERLALS